MTTPLKFVSAADLMREESPCYDAEWYCENDECIVREIRVHVKDYAGELTTDAVCPQCLQPAKFHGRIRTQ